MKAETPLRIVTKEKKEISFSQRWRGKFQAAGGDDERFRALVKRYLLAELYPQRSS